jgi:ABC-2 type transport system permease protein
MNPRRVAALTRRIVAQFRRDRRTLALLFVVPIAITALLGWVLRDQQQPATRAVIVNLDAAAGERVANALVTAAGGSGGSAGGVAGLAGIQIVERPADEVAARVALSDDRADLAVIIPAGFGAAMLTGGQPTLTLITQGLNPAADGSHLGAFQRALTDAIGALAPPAASVRVPRLVHATVFGSPNADALETLAPVFIGYFAYFFVFILTGVSFLRERIGGTLERLLATPITKAEIVLGYSLGFGIFATLQVLLLLAFSLMDVAIPSLGPLPAFHVGLGIVSAGSPLLAFLIALVLALGAVSLGIFLSTFARTELQVLQFIPIVIVPQGLLAGIFWPIDTLPTILQPFSRLLPLTYAVEALRSVMIAGAGLASATVRLDLAVLTAIAAFFVVLAAFTIRREVA